MNRTKNSVAIAGFGALLGCGAPASLPIAPVAMPEMWKTDWATTAGAELQYQVRALEGGKSLWIEALTPTHATKLDVPGRMRAFVRDAAVMNNGNWTPLDPSSFAFSCAAPPCMIRYRYLLAEAADRFDDKDLALADHSAIYSPVSAWLFATDGASAGAKYRLHVTTPPGLAFVSGVFRAKGLDAYEGVIEKMGEAPYGGFGTFDVRSFEVKGASIDVAITPGGTGVSSDRLVAWMKTQASAVAAYYGSFPISRLLVIVRSGGPGAIGGGSTMGEGGASILLNVGRETTEEDLAEDWVTVHEMVHVSFPSVLRPWAEEGLATYVEPIIRARAGLLDRDHVWRDLILGLPKGQPAEGDGGLDGRPTWGRTYWGGAAFWLLADVEIRKRTENKRSIDDALRGVVSGGGNVAVTWKLEEALGAGDRAVGTPVLVELYHSMKDKPVKVDLDDLWKRLGVRLERRKVIYDDAAPLAAVRKGITGG
jgi:hypothetical protein